MRWTPESDHWAIYQLSASLPTRPDAERVRHVLGETFIAHIDDLWPAGSDQGSREWIAANVDSILATVERLYVVALSAEHSGAAEFFERLAWLPELLAEIDHCVFRAD